MRKIKQSKFMCWRCGTIRTIKTKDLTLLQLGDRMAYGLFIRCNSNICKNQWVIQVPITNWSKAITKRRYKLFKKGKSTDEYFKENK